MWRAIQSLLANVSTLIERRKDPNAAELPRRYHPPAGPIVVSGLMVDERDRTTLSNLEEHGQWQVRLADVREASADVFRHLESPIIIWDRDLPCDDWREVVSLLASLPHRPCVLLLSRVVDDYLWNEVVRCGGYDVLPKPLREVELARALRLAWSYWASTATAPARTPRPSVQAAKK